MITKDVNTSAVNRFLTQSKLKNNEIHAFSVYKGGEKKVSLAFEPYNATDRREIYSLSKSFTSCAIGALWDEGKIKLDEKIVDIFPEKVPANASDNLKAMTVYDLLTMNTGHEECVMINLYNAADPVRAFMDVPVPHKPGSWFVYNTGASCMLTLIAERKAGKPFFEYVSEKILTPLDITGAYWTQCAAEQCEGGIGLHVTLEEIERFGLMLAAKGVYNGKRILSQKWVETAGAAQVDNSRNGDSGTGNWTSGYGFQFWRTAHDGYRGDGLKGQLCMIMPKNDCVVSIVACTEDMEGEIADAVELVENLTGANDETPDLTEYPPLCAAEEPEKWLDNTVTLKKNPMQIKTLCLHKTPEGLCVIINGTQTLLLGNGRWQRSELHLSCIVPKITVFMDAYKVEPCRIAASYTFADGTLTVRMRHLSDPHTVTAVVTERNGKLHADLNCEMFAFMLLEEARTLDER